MQGDIFNAAWDAGLSSVNADYLLSDGTNGSDGFAVSVPQTNSGGGFLDSIWNTLTSTASKVVDYWGQGVVASNAPNPPVYTASGTNPYPYRTPPVSQESQQDRNYTAILRNPYLIGGLALAGLVAVMTMRRK